MPAGYEETITSLPSFGKEFVLRFQLQYLEENHNNRLCVGESICLNCSNPFEMNQFHPNYSGRLVEHVLWTNKATDAS